MQRQLSALHDKSSLCESGLMLAQGRASQGAVVGGTPCRGASRLARAMTP